MNNASPSRLPLAWPSFPRLFDLSFTEHRIVYPLFPRRALKALRFSQRVASVLLPGVRHNG